MDKKFKEKEVENLIETHLLTNAGYIKGSPLDYDTDFCSASRINLRAASAGS